MTRQDGFTLIELIVVVVLLGIMAAGGATLVVGPIEAYNDQVRRQRLVDSAEMALRRIAADIRRALPNSIRVVDPNDGSGWALEMANTVQGARYRDEYGGSYTSDTDILQFSTADSEFNLMQEDIDLYEYASTPTSLKVVVYNTDDAAFFKDAEENDGSGVISDFLSSVSATAGSEVHLILSAVQLFPYNSPGQRLFFVDGPISYVCDASTGVNSLVRVSGYSWQELHGDTDTVSELEALSGAASGRITSQVAGCDIDYDPGTAQRAGLVTLEITLQNSAGESVTLLHQVHVDNAP